MKVNRLLLILFTMTCLTGIYAQDSTSLKKIREFHLQFSGFQNISVQIKYKTQIGAKIFFKAGLIDLSFYQNETKSGQPTLTRTRQYSAGLELGIEFRTNLYKQFAFYHGPNIQFSYMGSETKTWFPDRTTGISMYSAGIPYTLGLLFNLKNHFYFSAEINPGIFYSTGTNNFESISIGFNNRYGALSLAYRL